MRNRLLLATTLAASALVGMLPCGCSKKIHLPVVVDQRPTVRLTAAPIAETGPSGKPAKYIYHYKLSWVGYDPDGKVDHFLYTIDPPGSPGGGDAGATSECGKPVNGDTAWCRTTLNEKEIFFAASIPDSIDPTNPTASQIHTFVIKAVDNSGEESPPVYRSFFSFTQAPTVQIDAPAPSGLLSALVTPFVLIHWQGSDPDGVFTQKPIKYKFKMFKEGDPPFDFPPDSLRRYYAPNFFGWDSSSADTTSATYTNLVPDSRYLFVVVGFDEAGAYSPIFSRSENMLQMYVTYANINGPIITIFNEFFNYTYASGGYNTDPSRYIHVEVPARQPVHFNWGAVASRGSQMKQYRWAMDIANLADQTPRINEQTDLKHWSQAGIGNVSATVGPFTSDTTHTFFIEAEDINGLKSLGIVAFHVIVPTFNSDLLVVNDTRMFADEKVDPPDPRFPDSLAAPQGSWPSRAELDTFMFARGGVRWKMTPNGTLSPPGLFAGYRYDSVYTRAGQTNGVVSLALLGGYKHVVWFTEGNSATGSNSILGPGVLYSMSQRGHANTLAAYIALGGRVWLAGGTSIEATMLPWDVPTNNFDPPAGVTKYSATGIFGKPAELGPGRMPYDQGHWRSDIWLTSSNSAFPHKSVQAVGGYPERIDPRYGIVQSPDYSLLPTRLNAKDLTDATPPWRSRPSFLSAVGYFNLEFMTPGNPGLLQNAILENVNPNPDSTTLVSMLDTLLITPLSFSGIPVENEDLSNLGRNYACYPVMTYYHGFDCAPMLLSGHDLWSFRRTDLIQLVDFVLQQCWGLTKEPIVAPAAAHRAPPGPHRITGPEMSAESSMTNSDRRTRAPRGLRLALSPRPSRASTLQVNP